MLRLIMAMLLYCQLTSKSFIIKEEFDNVEVEIVISEMVISFIFDVLSM